MQRHAHDRCGVVAALGLALVVGGAPRSSAAANEAHVRTPVLWPSSCGIVVERAAEPIVHLDYAIPNEDTVLEDDELADSRTHQFIALCRQHPETELLPPWITRDDVERSVAAEIVEPDAVIDREILDESSVWAGCFARISADDERRPIDFASAAAGVDWDTSAVTPGVWSVSGYTFEPPLNLWSDRPGFVKIVDTRDDPDQDLPALALLGSEQGPIEVGETIALEACADVLEPAEVQFEWAPFAPFLDWQPLAEQTLDGDGAFTPQLRAPAAAAGQEILVRARIVDAQGREYVAHAPARIGIVACSPMGCPDPDDDDDTEPEPTGCMLESPATPLGWLLLLPLLLMYRSARSKHTKA